MREASVFWVCEGATLCDTGTLVFPCSWLDPWLVFQPSSCFRWNETASDSVYQELISLSCQTAVAGDCVEYVHAGNKLNVCMHSGKNMQVPVIPRRFLKVHCNQKLGGGAQGTL